MNYRHIMAATDFSELGDLVVARAIELARANAGRVTVVHILLEPEPPSPLLPHYGASNDANRRQHAREVAVEALRENVAPHLREGELEIAYEVRVGDPAEEILALDIALKPDLLVIATHGRRGFQHWVMGSVAERIVQMARADVLTVRTHPATTAPSST